MGDHIDLIARLRERGGDPHATHGESGARDCADAADALEARAREIDRLKQELGWPTETERRLAEAERDAERLNSRTIRFGDHVYCDVDLRACIDAAREGK